MPEARRSRTRQKNSRGGCKNCKLRSVRCDLTKPKCSKCRKSCLVCDYVGSVTELSSQHEEKALFSPLLLDRCSDNLALLSSLNQNIAATSQLKYSEHETFQLSMVDLERLWSFQNLVLDASGPKPMAQMYQLEAPKLIATHRHLLHVAMALTAMYERYINLQSFEERTPWECYHSALASRYLNKDISAGPGNHDGNAIWMSAALLGFTSMFSVETNDPEQAWPLKTFHQTDNMTWLEMHKGLRTLWATLDFDSNLSLFQGRRFSPGQRCLGFHVPKSGPFGVVSELATLCNLTASSTAENNPYYSAAHILSWLICEPNCAKTLRFLSFANGIDPPFERLLKQKDPRALLMLGIWYEIAEPSRWWMHGRAAVERRAIGTYLARHCDDEPGIKPFMLGSLCTMKKISLDSILECRRELDVSDDIDDDLMSMAPTSKLQKVKRSQMG